MATQHMISLQGKHAVQSHIVASRYVFGAGQRFLQQIRAALLEHIIFLQCGSDGSWQLGIETQTAPWTREG